MSFGPAFDAKEQVRQAIDIVDLVGSYVQLRRQGRNFVGLCPWHDDSRPSLQVNPDRQSFKCWVCDYRRRHLQLRDAGRRPGVPRSAGNAGRTRRHSTAIAAATRQRAGRSPAADPRTTSARSTASWPGPRSNSTAACSSRPKPNRAAQYLAERGITAETHPPLPPRLCARSLGLAPRTRPRHASGRRRFSSASACCAAKSSAAATTIGSAAG